MERAGVSQSSLAAEYPQEIPGPAAATGRMVADFSSALSSSHDEDEVAAIIVNQLAELGAVCCHLVLVESDTQRLTLAAQHGVPKEFMEHLEVVSPDAPLLAACAARTRELQRIDVGDASSGLMLAKQLLEATQSSSMISLPLVAVDELVGVLTWTESGSVTLTEDAIATLRALADVLALGIVNARNVTALRRSNQRFEEIIAAAPIGMSIVSLDGRFLRPNRALCEILGYSTEELKKLRFQDITYPEDLQKDLDLVGQLARGEIPRYQLPKRYIRKDGRIIEAILHGSVIRDAYEPLYYIAQIEDVTEVNRRQQALARSEARLRLLAQNAQDMIYRFRFYPEPGFDYVSPASTRLTGYTPEELHAVPELGLRMVHPDDRRWLENLWEHPTDISKPGLVRFIHKNGHVVWVEQRNTPVYDGDKIIAMEGIARDVTQRRMGEEALTESEERLRFVVNHSPDTMFVQDRSLRYVWVVNSAIMFQSEQVIGKSDFDFLPAAQAARLAHLKREVLESGEGCRRVVSLTPSDQQRFFHISYEPWRNPDGEIIGVAGYARDITAEKENEAALRDSTARLRMWQHVAGIGSWDWELTTNRLHWSDEVYRIMGVEPGSFELTYRAFMSRVHPDDYELIDDGVREALSGGSRFSADYRFTRDDGEITVVHTEADVLGEPGFPERMVGFVQNITERYQLEQESKRLVNELAAEKHWLDEVIDSSPIGMVLFEGSGGVRANRMAEEILGPAADMGDGSESPAARLYYPDGVPLPPEELVSTRVLRGERIEGLELLVRHRDKLERRVLGNAVPLHDSEGRVIGGVAVFADITRLRELERMREEWAGIIAHDLRQPLTLMLTRTQMLHERCRDQGDFSGEFEHLLSSISRMNRMVGELLDASLLQSDRVVLHQTREDLSRILASTIERAGPLGNQVVLEGPRDPLYAYVDWQRIEQVMLNLLTNAAKYGRTDRPILVRLEPRGNEALISVQNEGDPIPADELPTLFDRFWRARGAGEKASGLGLGLYIVHGLVAAHGGDIWAESTPSGVTTFRFTLPVGASSH